MSSIAEKVIQVADSLKYIREATNHNDHPMIDRMLEYLGLPHHLSWCLAFCLWCWHVAVAPAALPFPKIARCSSFWEYVQARELRYRTFTPEDVRWGIEKPQPGDIGIFSHNPQKRNWDGHAVLVVRQINRKSFRTIEGNTVPGAEGNQREGGGVYYRTRYNDIRGLHLEGFVRPR